MYISPGVSSSGVSHPFPFPVVVVVVVGVNRTQPRRRCETSSSGLVELSRVYYNPLLIIFGGVPPSQHCCHHSRTQNGSIKC